MQPRRHEDVSCFRGYAWTIISPPPPDQSGAPRTRASAKNTHLLFSHRFPQLRLGLRSSRGVYVYVAIEIQIELLENRNEGFDVIVSRLPRSRQREVALEQHLLLRDVRDHQAI